MPKLQGYILRVLEKEFSKVFQGSFKVVSEKLQQCAKSVSKAHPGSFKGFFKVLSWCFRDAWHFLCVSRVIDGLPDKSFFKQIYSTFLNLYTLFIVCTIL